MRPAELTAEENFEKLGYILRNVKESKTTTKKKKVKVTSAGQELFEETLCEFMRHYEYLC